VVTAGRASPAPAPSSSRLGSRLERDGLLVRTVYPTVPPKVEYTATPMARELYDSLVTLTTWAERHRAEIAAARIAYDREHGTPPGSAAAEQAVAGAGC